MEKHFLLFYKETKEMPTLNVKFEPWDGRAAHPMADPEKRKKVTPLSGERWRGQAPAPLARIYHNPDEEDPYRNFDGGPSDEE